MSLCHQCGKPVYFAERRTALGKDWHRQCLRCEECGKVLAPGQHAEHKGRPYCHIPCYTALFGPTMYGHGSPIFAHKSFGREAQKEKKDSPIKRSDLQMRVKAFNKYHEGKTNQLKTREVNGRLVLEGPLRVYWGVTCPIQLKPKDDTAPPTPKAWRRSYVMAIHNGLEEDLLQRGGDDEDTAQPHRESLDDLDVDPGSPKMSEDGTYEYDKSILRFNSVDGRSNRRKNRQKRLSIINGHMYDLETSVFTPAHGTLTSVRVTSLDAAPMVIKLLLDKFKVLNSPDEFCLCTVKTNAETKVLKAIDYPLVERVLMGPLEDENKIFIMEKSKVNDIPAEVAQFTLLPEPMLKAFLEKYQKEEEEELQQIVEKYTKRKQDILDRMKSLAKSGSR